MLLLLTWNQNVVVKKGLKSVDLNDYYSTHFPPLSPFTFLHLSPYSTVRTVTLTGTGLIATTKITKSVLLDGLLVQYVIKVTNERKIDGRTKGKKEKKTSTMDLHMLTYSTIQ